MMQEKDGIIWLGTDDGVFCYDGTIFTDFVDRTNIMNADSLNMKAIVSIIQGHLKQLSPFYAAKP